MFGGKVQEEIAALTVAHKSVMIIRLSSVAAVMRSNLILEN
jgi:hypothetical protein